MRVDIDRSAPVIVRGPDPECQRERHEAQVSQRVANRDLQEAQAYGGQRQYRQADRAQAQANQQRAQAIRACD